MAPQTSSRSALAAIGALTGGLLSSSCCVLQLLLNYTSIGCAGFSVLTPWAGHFRLLTGGFLAYLVYANGLTRRTLSTAAVSLLLMVSQDLLRAHNTGALQQLLQQYRLAPQAAQPQQQQQEVVVAAQRTLIRVAGMRCEGCAARLRSNLAGVQGVDSCMVQFSVGTVEVWSNGTQGVPTSALLDAIRATDSSYTAQVISRQCYDDHEDLLQEGPAAAETQEAAAGSKAEEAAGIVAAPAAKPVVDEL